MQGVDGDIGRGVTSILVHHTPGSLLQLLGQLDIFEQLLQLTGPIPSCTAPV